MISNVYSSMYKILFIAFFIVAAMNFSESTAGNLSVLTSSVRDSPINDPDSAGSDMPVRTVGDVCSVNLDVIGSSEYVGFSSAEKAIALTVLRRCMEIHNAHTSAIKAVEEIENDERMVAKFQGVNFGIGVGLSQSQDDMIEEAVLVGGVVKTKVDRADKVRVVMDMHIFLACNKGKRGRVRGCGPFLAVSPSDDQILSGVGIGWMWGWKNIEPEKSDAFTIGLGLMADQRITTLAPGFYNDRPLPAGETEIRYIEEAGCSTLLFVSRSF